MVRQKRAVLSAPCIACVPNDMKIKSSSNSNIKTNFNDVTPATAGRVAKDSQYQVESSTGANGDDGQAAFYHLAICIEAQGRPEGMVAFSKKLLLFLHGRQLELRCQPGPMRQVRHRQGFTAVALRLSQSVSLLDGEDKEDEG